MNIEINEINIMFATNDAKCVVQTLCKFVTMSMNDALNSLDDETFTISINNDDDDDNELILIELSSNDAIVFRASCAR